MPHSHVNQFNVLSGFLIGRATTLKGWSFLYFSRSFFSRSSAFSRIFNTLRVFPFFELPFIVHNKKKSRVVCACSQYTSIVWFDICAEMSERNMPIFSAASKALRYVWC